MESWNIDADIYVSKYGSDSTGDGSASNPFLTIAAATNIASSDGQVIGIGNGIWQEIRGTSPHKLIFRGNTSTVFDGSGTAFFYILAYETIENCNIRNYTIPARYISYNNTSNNENVTFINCTIKYVRFYNSTTTAKIGIINLYGCMVHQFYVSANKSHLRAINTTFYKHIDKAFYGAYFAVCINTIFYKCWFKYISNVYAAPSAYPAKILTNNCRFNTVVQNESSDLTLSENLINADPLFVAPERGDFTLQKNSPCINTGLNNKHIGAFGYSYPFTANSTEFTEQCGAIFSKNANGENQIFKTLHKINNIYVNSFALLSTETSGNVESCWYDMGKTEQILISHIYNTFIETVAPTLGTSEKIYFQLKYALSEDEKDTATWKNIFWNSVMTVDVNGYGNADDNFTSGTKIAARYIKIKLFITKS